MCGFLFEFTVKQPLARESFHEILKLSQKRGPDHTAYWSNNATVQMGFNRLAILELSAAGNQPMLSPAGRYVLVFNGEIYNHLVLRKLLSFTNFKGHGDTETICACLDEWGVEKTIAQLDGMFAIALYDHQTGGITLARDFAGIKPLFYGWDGHTLMAASQFDQVVKHPVFNGQPVDEQVLKLYLQQHFLPAPFGLLKNTFQVAPGEMVHISAQGRLEKKPFWVFPEYYTPTISEHSDALAYLSEALDNAVKEELLSDVPLGAFLSGGIDSPLICYYAMRHKDLLKTFTIGSDSKIHDESIDASLYAQQLGSRHTTSIMNDASGRDILQEVFASMHEPMADFSIIPTYLVSKLAREQVTIALSGDGGDELFFGYERFWSIAKNIRYQHLPWVIKAGLYKSDQWLSNNKRINSVLLDSSQSHAHGDLHSRFPDGWMDKLFPHLKTVSLPDLYNTYDYPNSRSTSTLIQHMRKAEFYGMMQKTLRKVDLASMDNSLEVRVPFLKKSFIEASLKIDPMLSYAPGKKKQMLRDLLRQRLPESSQGEMKRGFSVPLGQWIRKEMRKQFEDLLLQKSFLTTYGVQEQQVMDLLKHHENGKDMKWPIFTLAALSAWQSKTHG